MKKELTAENKRCLDFCIANFAFEGLNLTDDEIENAKDYLLGNKTCEQIIDAIKNQRRIKSI